MPNTPALVGEGMTGISYNTAEFSFEERDIIEKFFNSFGKVVTVPENLMSGVVCASGSSPAYVYMFIEALADGAVKYGIPRKDAYKLVQRMGKYYCEVVEEYTDSEWADGLSVHMKVSTKNSSTLLTIKRGGVDMRCTGMYTWSC
jgi:pyrroline-5-carboxylate reductase